MFAVSSDSELIPTYVAYKAARMMPSCMHDCPYNTRYNRSKFG